MYTVCLITWNLIVVILRDRHRRLAMAIDRAVLLPGQELMEKMDRECSSTGKGCCC